MIETFGVTLSFHFPPFSFSFGITPLYWSMVQRIVTAECTECGGISRAVSQRLGPLIFVVCQNHEHDAE